MKAFFSILIFITISLSGQGQERDSLGFLKPIGWVNDFERIFTVAQLTILDSIIINHKNETTNQIVIVTLDTTFDSEDDLYDYSLQLMRRWGVGMKNKDNGIGIVFGTKARMIRIQNGYEIETRLSDQETKQIIDSIIIPEFKKGDYFEGIKNGLLAIIEKIK